MLQQKYIIFATEDGYDGSDSNMFFFVATQSRATDYTVTDLLFTLRTGQENRKLVTRDENGNVRTNGDATSIVHNLGFLLSTASLPTNAANFNIGSRTSKIPVHLKYRTGDKVQFIAGEGFGTTARIRVTEVLDTGSTPAWYQVLEVLTWYPGGGTPDPDLIGTVPEHRPPWLPTDNQLKLPRQNIRSAPLADELYTGRFVGALSEYDTSLQEAFETLDQHTHSGTYQPLDSDLTAIAALSPANDDIIQRKAGAWTNRTLAQLMTDLTELIQDLVGDMFAGSAHAGISAVYNDPAGDVELELDTTQIENVAIPHDGWIEDASWTRTGNHTFTSSGDRTAIFRKGLKVRYKDGGSFEYGVVGSSSHAAGTTTINLIVNSDYQIAAATLTEVAYSPIENPAGFPQWFNWSVTWTNLTVGSGTVVSKWRVSGQQIFYEISFTYGSGSSVGDVSFAPPITSALGGTRPPAGEIVMLDSGTANFYGAVVQVSSTSFGVRVNNAAGTYTANVVISSTIPMTWTTSDELNIKGAYRF